MDTTCAHVVSRGHHVVASRKKEGVRGGSLPLRATTWSPRGHHVVTRAHHVVPRGPTWSHVAPRGHYVVTTWSMRGLEGDEPPCGGHTWSPRGPTWPHVVPRGLTWSPRGHYGGPDSRKKEGASHHVTTTWSPRGHHVVPRGPTWSHVVSRGRRGHYVAATWSLREPPRGHHVVTTWSHVVTGPDSRKKKGVRGASLPL